MKRYKKVLFLLILILTTSTVFAQTNHILSDTVFTPDEVENLNHALNTLSSAHDFDLFIEIDSNPFYKIEALNAKDAKMLLTIDLSESTWEFTSSPKAASLYNRKTQTAFMDKAIEDLEKENYTSFIRKLIEDITHQLLIPKEEKTKELFSIKRLVITGIIAFLIALVMTQSQKNKLKSFRTRKTALTYLSDFKIVDKKENLIDVKKHHEYIDKHNSANTQQGSKGKF